MRAFITGNGLIGFAFSRLGAGVLRAFVDLFIYRCLGQPLQEGISVIVSLSGFFFFFFSRASVGFDNHCCFLFEGGGGAPIHTHQIPIPYLYISSYISHVVPSGLLTSRLLAIQAPVYTVMFCLFTREKFCAFGRSNACIHDVDWE